jgi:hypothetical protein
MAASEIDLKRLKVAVNAVLDHLMDDLGIQKVQINDAEDFYWECPPSEAYDASKKPAELDAGRLSDDVDFMNLIQRGQCGDTAYNLVHVAPLLRYVGEKIKK